MSELLDLASPDLGQSDFTGPLRSRPDRDAVVIRIGQLYRERGMGVFQISQTVGVSFEDVSRALVEDLRANGGA